MIGIILTNENQSSVQIGWKYLLSTPILFNVLCSECPLHLKNSHWNWELQVKDSNYRTKCQFYITYINMSRRIIYLCHWLEYLYSYYLSLFRSLEVIEQVFSHRILRSRFLSLIIRAEGLFVNKFLYWE